MEDLLSDKLPRVWQEVVKLNTRIRDIWNYHYPMGAIDAYNDYREKNLAARQANWKPIIHLAPIQYPDIVFAPTTGGGTLNNHGSDIFATQDPSTPDRSSIDLLLFIGLNPSSPDVNIANEYHGYEDRNVNYDRIVQHEAAVWKSYKTYFGPIESFKTPLFKYHVDMFALRHTNAQDIKILMQGRWTKNAQHIASISKFFEEQFNALHEFIHTVCPSQAIVINADAGRVFTDGLGSHRGYRESSNWQEEPARITCGGWPTFMHSSGMMSNGSMNKGSKTRLESVSYAVHQHGRLK
jgi:hypothetical protein